MIYKFVELQYPETNIPLLSDEEFNQYMQQEGGGSKLVWNNYFTEIGDGGLYRGQYTQDR